MIEPHRASPVDAFLREDRDLGLQIVTHEVEFVPAVLFGRMNRQFRGRQREDRPSVAGVDGRESGKF
jgi:hypothetical protein